MFDRECAACGHDGMKKTQVPAPGGPEEAFECPACGYIDRDEDGPSGTYVSKR